MTDPIALSVICPLSENASGASGGVGAGVGVVGADGRDPPHAATIDAKRSNAARFIVASVRRLTTPWR